MVERKKKWQIYSESKRDWNQKFQKKNRGNEEWEYNAIQDTISSMAKD